MSRLPPVTPEENRSRFRELALQRVEELTAEEKAYLLYRFVTKHPIDAVDFLNLIAEHKRQHEEHVRSRS